MRCEEFVGGREFRCGGHRWRCTDVGTRTIVAIKLDRNGGWYAGPPYAVPEVVFDEHDVQACVPT